MRRYVVLRWYAFQTTRDNDYSSTSWKIRREREKGETGKKEGKKPTLVAW